MNTRPYAIDALAGDPTEQHSIWNNDRMKTLKQKRLADATPSATFHGSETRE